MSFEVLSNHGDVVEHDVVADQSSEESTETMTPLPPVSWFQETRTSKHAQVLCGKFLKPFNGNDRRDGEESSFLMVGIAGMSSLVFFSKWTLGHRTYRNLYQVRKVASQ